MIAKFAAVRKTLDNWIIRAASLPNPSRSARPDMTSPIDPQGQPDASHPWPSTVAEAVTRLVQALDQSEMNEVAGTPEDGLIDLHFSYLGATIREDFGLWRGNAALLADCQRVRLEGGADGPVGMPAINPDDAAMVVIRALWERLRH